MIRVKDHEASLKFYQEIMGMSHDPSHHRGEQSLNLTAGMSLVLTWENPSDGFNVYFVAYPGDEWVPKESAVGVGPTFERGGLLELTWNYGTEKDANHRYRKSCFNPT